VTYGKKAGNSLQLEANVRLSHRRLIPEVRQKNQKVRIVNPVPNGPCLMGMNRASRYVHTGRAEWVSPQAIRFNEGHPMHQSILAQARLSTLGYDQRGIMRRDEIRRIPMLFPERLK
jgi:hypothetical protein